MTNTNQDSKRITLNDRFNKMNSTIVEEMSNTPQSYNNHDSVLETVTENKNYTTFSPDARQNKKKKSNGKCMSIRDIILDR